MLHLWCRRCDPSAASPRGPQGHHRSTTLRRRFHQLHQEEADGGRIAIAIDLLDASAQVVLWSVAIYLSCEVLLVHPSSVCYGADRGADDLPTHGHRSTDVNADGVFDGPSMDCSRRLLQQAFYNIQGSVCRLQH
ncbi:hypothetical protein ACP70R_016517 [Stipagrostis hirtigluma subsp. patula]